MESRPLPRECHILSYRAANNNRAPPRDPLYNVECSQQARCAPGGGGNNVSDLHKLFYPESVAVSGVSHKPDNMASMIVMNLVHWCFKGRVYGLNPTRKGRVHSKRIYRTLEDIEDDIDVVVALSPARTIPDLLDQCAEKGVKFIILESGGFSEYDEAGAKLGETIKAKAREYGIRFTGPNGLGVINADNRFVTPFPFLEPFQCGNVSVVAQSGGVGLSIIHGLREHNMTFNKFVSMGNKYDLDESDYLEYLAQDPGTEVIVMFLESIRQGRRFMKIAAACDKPIIVYKAGVTEAGRTRAQSHTASLANDDAVVDAALRQAGVIRVHNINDLVHFARMFTQPAMEGNRLVAISPAGGFTVISADELSAGGFTFPPLGEKTLKLVHSQLRAGVVRVENPMDLGDAFASDTVLMALEQALMQDNVDGGVLVMPRRKDSCYIGPFAVMLRNIIPEIQTLVRKVNKPVVSVIYAMPEQVVQSREDVTIPVYPSMDITVRAFAAFRDFCARSKNPPKAPSGTKPRLPDKAKKILAKTKSGMLVGKPAFDLLAAMGVPVPACTEAAEAKQAADAAARMGGPVAMKISSGELSHKSDAGGVILNVEGRAARTAANSLADVIEKHKVQGKILVQKMAAPGVELIVGARRDPSFGPVVLVGMGGVFVEVMRDTVLRVAPVNKKQAEDMLHGLAGSALLTGARGRKPVDLKAVAAVITAVAGLMAADDRIAELDINPLIAAPDGCTAVDVRIGITGT